MLRNVRDVGIFVGLLIYVVSLASFLRKSAVPRLTNQVCRAGSAGSRWALGDSRPRRLMMSTNDEDVPVKVSKTKARGGVTGHNVRYVLAFGLLGIIAAFIALGIYYRTG